MTKANPLKKNLPKADPNKLAIKIPAPTKTEDGYKFYPIVRVGRLVPFGYESDPDDPDLLQPIPEELELLEQAKAYLKSYSLRDVAVWLSHHSGRSISHVGLRKRVLAEQYKEREYVDARRLAKQFLDAYRKAKRLEASRLGKKEPLTEDIDAELFASVSQKSTY